MKLSKAAMAVAGSSASRLGQPLRSMASIAPTAFQEKYPHLLPHAGIISGYNNEDGACELLMVSRLQQTTDKKLRCLVVTGGGDNFLSLLAHPSVQHVTAVDTDPMAQALAQTKVALAKSTLSKEQVLTFLGAYDKPIEDMDRLAVFEDHVKPHLEPTAVSTLESLTAPALEHGFVLFGALENCNRHINHVLETKEGFSLKDIFEGNCNDLDRLERVLYNKDEPLFSAEEYLEVAGLDRILPPHIMEVFLARLKDGFLQKCLGGHYQVAGLTSSHIARMTFLHAYSDECHPEWLNESVRQRLRETDSSVEFVNSNFLELGDEDAKYDLISPSNIFDWMPMEKSTAGIKAACDNLLAPGHGLFLLRRAFGGVPDMVSAMEDKLMLCPEITSQTLAEADKAPFFYRNEEGMACLQLR
ncbi:expressed unknown protein [Seminavis robusta]|uniref:Uncharacterized protein n=1 Tax=Seminavis robusta TaxID=568900 RepID=A0A9N8DZD7_9STRA|nr:expressed unknown protein [Seminavis robusta]|eukprot:Sro468_g149040.1 n/a (415) ;mRNA; f:4732-5976